MRAATDNFQRSGVKPQKAGRASHLDWLFAFMDTERWAVIKDYEGRYEISSHGRVRSMRTGRILKYYLRMGYPTAPLNKRGQKNISIHRLVAEAFTPNLSGLPQVNHIDGNRQNNHWANLEWCTLKTNIQHFYHSRSVDMPLRRHAKLDREKAAEIRRLLAEGIKPKPIAAMFGVTNANVQWIKKGKTWVDPRVVHI
jgi:hypothetical protein